MKRSEMLTKIDDHLINRGFHKGGSFDLAWSILEVIEKAGMSPPDWDGTVYGYNEGLISPPEWEPEDNG